MNQSINQPVHQSVSHSRNEKHNANDHPVIEKNLYAWSENGDDDELAI